MKLLFADEQLSKDVFLERIINSGRFNTDLLKDVFCSSTESDAEIFEEEFSKLVPVERAPSAKKSKLDFGLEKEFASSSDLWARFIKYQESVRNLRFKHYLDSQKSLDLLEEDLIKYCNSRDRQKDILLVKEKIVPALRKFVL